MARSVLADSGFLVALLSRRDGRRDWAVAIAKRFPPPWHTCEPVLSETYHLLGPAGLPAISELLTKRALVARFRLDTELERVVKLMERYAEVPMSFADACLVRMTEVVANPVLLTTDGDFRIYRRHGRQAIPAILPP